MSIQGPSSSLGPPRLPFFTRASWKKNSANFAFWGFSEVRQEFIRNSSLLASVGALINLRRGLITPPFSERRKRRPTPIIAGRSGPSDGDGDPPAGGVLLRRTSMKPRGLWAAGVLLLLLVVGLVGVLAIGAGYAKEENASRAKCSEATLHGTYLFAYDGFVIKDNEKVPFASSGYEVYDGNGHTKGVSTTNVNGKVSSKEQTSPITSQGPP